MTMKRFPAGHERVGLFLLLLSGLACVEWVEPPTIEAQPPTTGTPEVIAVNPPRVARGNQVTLKIKGKNFVSGTRISFGNPDIHVLEIATAKSKELMARIQVAPDAAMGATGLFVFNPDDREAEVAFEVTAADAAGPAGQKPTSTPVSANAAPLRFEVLNLGEASSILQNPDKAKGTLSLMGGKLRYEEGGTQVFSVAPANITEIGANSILGLNTGTFHVILDSGKIFNFMAASMRPRDSQSILDSLRRALP